MNTFEAILLIALCVWVGMLLLLAPFILGLAKAASREMPQPESAQRDWREAA